MKKLNLRRSTMLLAVSMAMAAGTVYADGSAPAAGNTRSDTSQNATSSGGNTQNGASAYVYGQSPSDSKMDDRGSLPPNNTSEATGTPSSGTSQQQSSGASDSGESSSAFGQGQAEDSSGASGKSSGNQADSSDSSGASNSGASGTGKKGGTSTVFLMVPVDIASNDNATKKGCWAKVYDRENFAGESLTLVGPVSLADMGGPFGLNWDDKVKSIETGPKARVTVYDNEGFRDQVAEFKPNQRIGDTSKRMGYFDEFASVRIDC